MPTFLKSRKKDENKTIKGTIKNFNGCASLSHKREKERETIIKEVLKCNQLVWLCWNDDNVGNDDYNLKHQVSLDYTKGANYIHLF